MGDTCPTHRHQGCRLCAWGSCRVGRQEEAGGWTAPVEDRHTHEGNTSSTVDNSQDKSRTSVGRWDGEQLDQRGHSRSMSNKVWYSDSYPFRVRGAKLRVLTLIRLYLFGWYWWGELGSTLEKLLSAAMVSTFTQPSLESFSLLDGCREDRARWTGDSGGKDNEWRRENRFSIERMCVKNMVIEINWLTDGYDVH